MFAKPHRSIRLAGFALAFVLATVATASVCAGLASFAADPHRCCKTSSHGGSSSGDNGCRTKCAGSSAFVIPAAVNFESSGADAGALPAAATDIPRPVPAIGTEPTTRSAGASPPLYELHSALLI